ncbi:flagellar filament capping protein FliD [Dongia sp.]|uniref:flagellar filament capping protein FliD n=1 Tax=Dongia sp. TaxID=1977262 RepID=UPI0035AE2B2B
MSVVSSSGSTTSGTAVTSATVALDTDALVEAAVAVRTAAADTIELKVTEAETIVSAYQELEALLLTLSEAADALRNPGSSTESDAFEERAVTLTASGTAEATDIMGASVGANAEIASYSIVIEQVATVHKIASDDQASRSDELGLTGTISLSAGDNTAVSIDITSDMTLDEIAAAINYETDNTGVKASVLKLDDESYLLVLTGSETNETIALSDSSGDVLETLGLITAAGEIGNELQSAQPAILTVDGISVTRSSNEIDDLIDEVTLYLYSGDEDTTITLDVGADLAGINTAIETFVEAYNAVRDFILTQQETNSDGEAADDAVLFGDALVRSLSNDLSSLLAEMTDDGATLAGIGITLDTDNKLVIDSSTLADALSSDLEAIEKLFRFSAETSSSELSVIDNGSTGDSVDFTLDIVVDADGNIASASVGGDDSLFTITGSRIEGAEGTAYEGIVFAYIGAESASVDVSITRGLAQKLSDTITDYAGTYSGDSDSRITELVDSLNDSITDMETEISNIQQRTEDYREWLTEYYAKIEAQINTASRLREQLAILLDDSDD